MAGVENNELLKVIQNDHLEVAKRLLLEEGFVVPIGFVFTRRDQVDNLLGNGWGIEFIKPKQIFTYERMKGSEVVGLGLDFAMDWERMYHALIRVLPKYRPYLEPFIQLAKEKKLDDPYMRTMRPFMEVSKMDEKDIIAATMKSICERVEAFGAMHVSEAYIVQVTDPKDRDKMADDLADEPTSTEVVMCSLETHEFIRMVTIPIKREASQPGKRRDSGKPIGFGEPQEHIYHYDEPGSKVEGRLSRFLSPLKTKETHATT